MKSDRFARIIFIAVGILLVVALLYGIFGPKPPNWKDTFTHRKKRPFDTYVLFEELSTLFPDAERAVIEKSVLGQLANEAFSGTAYLFINQELPFETDEVEELIRFASAGNEVFLASREIPYRLGDTLGIAITYRDYLGDSLQKKQNYDTVMVAMSSEKFSGKVFPFLQKRAAYSIEIVSSKSRIESLAESPAGSIYAVRIPVGTGHILVCSLPHALFQLSSAGNGQWGLCCLFALLS